MRSLLLATALLLLLPASGCRTIEDSTGFPPIIEHVGATDEFYVRPLVSVGPNEVKGLWPIFRHRKDERGRLTWLLPLYYYVSKRGERGSDRDLYIALIIIWGTSPGEGSHFAFFPFGGRVRGIFVQDEFDFVLFPCYLRLRDRERISRHVLFPIVNWIEAPHRSGWRVWPFYGTYEAETVEGTPKYRYTSVLWPFYTNQEQLLDTPTPLRGMAIFPFYGYSESKNISRRWVLWPLYAYSEDRKRDYRSWGPALAPWRYARGVDEIQTDIWPFYGWWQRGTHFRQFSLWPIQHSSGEDGPDARAERFWVLPFWWDTKAWWPARGDRLERRKVWPFFSGERTPGTYHWEALSLLPWFDETTDRFWGRFWQLARYRRHGEARAFELLWGLFSWEEEPAKPAAQAQGEAPTQARSAWRIGGGLFGVEEDGAAVTYRIFYLPIRTGG